MVKVHFIDWFVYEALALQTWGPEFDPPNSPLKKVWKHVLVILVLERQRQEDSGPFQPAILANL